MHTTQVVVTPQRVDLVVYAGDGVLLRLSAVNSQTGTSLDLAGEISAQIKAHRGDTESITEFTVDTDLAAEGILDLSLSGEQTASLLTDVSRFQGSWDVQWIADGEQPRTLVQGNLTCVLDVTRSA